MNVNKVSEDFTNGYMYVEDKLKEAIFQLTLKETKEKVLKGYMELLNAIETQKDKSAEDFLVGGIFALHDFMHRHGVQHEWRFKS